MTAYYNEIDPKAAAWLRELIKQGHIAPGDVDERSIVDVKAKDISGYTQCHFFAGIGVWSHALRQAGWDDSKEVWTASCPCQPFSSAGQGKGVKDERHLFPVLSKLIEVRKPGIIFGEQVSGKAGLAWFDDVQNAMEEIGYATGSVTFPACSVGSPHLRQRQYWMAKRLESDTPCLGWRGGSDGDTAGESRALQTQRLCASGGMGYTSVGRQWGGKQQDGIRNQRTDRTTGDSNPLANNKGTERQQPNNTRAGRDGLADSSSIQPTTGHSCPTNGLWRDVDWLYCRDGKWRPVEPGTFPLAHGATERVGRLRGYGNAIVAEQAVIFIETAMEILL